MYCMYASMYVCMYVCNAAYVYSDGRSMWSDTRSYLYESTKGDITKVLNLDGRFNRVRSPLLQAAFAFVLIGVSCIVLYCTELYCILLL